MVMLALQFQKDICTYPISWTEIANTSHAQMAQDNSFSLQRIIF